MKINKRVVAVFILLFTFISSAMVCHATKASPPQIVFIVNNSPRDLVLELDGASPVIEKKFGAKYYSFLLNYQDHVENEHFLLNVSTGKNSFGMTIDNSYANEFYTLNIKNRTLTQGKTLWLIIQMTVFRIFLVLCAGGIIFWLFGFRQKRSWIIFLIINLIPQIFISICTADHISASYMYGSHIGMLGIMVFAEILVFIFNIVALPVLVKEQKILRRIGGAFTVYAVNLVVILSLFPNFIE